MLDLKFIRDNPDLVRAGVAKKKATADIDGILRLDLQRRELLAEVERLRAERNRVSEIVAGKKKAKESADREIQEMRQVGDQIAQLDRSLRELEDNLHTALIWVPNLPHESAPVGTDESANVVVRQWGEIPRPQFKVLPHWEIGEKLGIVDLPAAARVAGSGFYLLRGAGARLQRALINFMLDLHAADGFTECVAPYIVTADAMFGTGQLPKLADDMYRIEKDNTYLIPTGEVPLTNLFRNEILSYQQLPVYLVAHTPCFRREAGAAGKDTRGMLRVHQFDKVELVKIVRPEHSYDELESLVRQAEKVIQQLNLPYRICELATGDLTFASTKCYDIELWAAGVEKYLEVSSISIFEDFQARRMNCRFRDHDKSIRFPHTLNGSGVALARLIAAILENYQNADGSITIPDILRHYFGGAATIF
ncbi:MAG TPA: serine--tRNA ligase [Candidatus Deferrimicrobium sp.]|nr:serine--tRNA ligase [Candidatus Deferrimicrobium sp.]